VKTIVVVDDEVTIADMLQSVLQEEGYEVVTAGNGREGLARVEEVRPDLVLCDVMMPILDGREVARAMEANPQYRSIPLVLMSAVGESIIKDHCTYAAFVAKPFDLDELLGTIEGLIGVANAR
jgi:two-component system alkaline phosphatase synthesis response regulator PhoP